MDRICEEGNWAVHDGNLSLDLTFLATGMIKPDQSASFRFVYGFDPFRFIPGYSGPEDLEVSEIDVQVMNHHSSISTQILIKQSDPEITDAVQEYVKIERQSDVSLLGNISWSTTSKAQDVPVDGCDVEETIEVKVDRMKALVQIVQKRARQMRWDRGQQNMFVQEV